MVIKYIQSLLRSNIDVQVYFRRRIGGCLIIDSGVYLRPNFLPSLVMTHCHVKSLIEVIKARLDCFQLAPWNYLCICAISQTLRAIPNFLCYLTVSKDTRVIAKPI